MNQDFSNLNAGGGHHPGLSSIDSISGIQPAVTPDQAPPVGQPTKDSIEKAAALVASLYMPSMANPILYPPDPNLTLAIGQLAMDKICLNILDSWSKSLQEIAEQKKEADRRDELNPILKEIHVTASLFLAVTSIFIRAIFGTQVAQALQKAGSTNDEKDIAKKFASQLAQWSSNGVLNGYLMTIVDQLPSAANLTEGQKKVLGSQIEVMLLSSALAGLYKAYQQGPQEGRWITAKEFSNLLVHPDVLNNDPNATQVASLIVNVLSALPEADRVRMTKTLSVYMDSNPDLPTLFDLGQTTDVQLSILNSSRT